MRISDLWITCKLIARAAKTSSQSYTRISFKLQKIVHIENTILETEGRS
jgi:hypothetical protein